MRHDPSAWLGNLEPEKPRNARSWGGSAGSGAIVPPSEIRNAASLDDARRASGLNPHLAQREDTREAFIKGREAREAKGDASDVLDPIPSQERRLDVLRAALARGDEPDEIREAWPTWWAVGGSTKTERMWHRDLAALKKEAPVPKHNPNAPKPSDVRRYLLEHGPTERDTLLEAVGFLTAYKNKETARTMLNKCLRELGASGGRGPARLPEHVADEKQAARVPPAKIVNSIGQEPVDFDALLAELSEASIDLDRALVRVEKAKAAVKEAAGR